MYKYSEIINNLYIGYNYTDIKKLNITHVISISTNTISYDDLNIVKYDFNYSDKLPVDECIKLIKTVTELIYNLRKQKENKIYIYCSNLSSVGDACILYYLHKNSAINNIYNFVSLRKMNIRYDSKIKLCLEKLIK